MTGSDRQVAGFLAGAGWNGARRAALAGDASARRYERLTDPAKGRTAILMLSPTTPTRPFAELSGLFLSAGLSAPRVLAADHDQGLLLLEDLGDAVFTRQIARDPDRERPLYAAATDLLHRLQAIPPPPDLAELDSVTLAEMTGIAFTRYARPITGDDVSDRIIPALALILRENVEARQVLVHRDYHADNLIWLPDRASDARVGLLDFQDAVTGHPVYDLVSLLQDARRDVPAGIELAMIARFLGGSDLTGHEVRTAYAVLGLQRNLRILGVFSRLARDFAKPSYLSLLPRVHGHVLRNLDHPALAPIADPLRDALPRPTPDTLSRLREAA